MYLHCKYHLYQFCHAYFYDSNQGTFTVFLMQGIIRHISRRSGTIMRGGAIQSVRPFFQKGWSQPWISSSCRLISHTNERIHAEHIPIYKKISAFVKGTAFTFGGLTLAGFMGYPVDSRDSKSLRDLRSQLEAIRKQYPSVRSFPVFFRADYFFYL